jgi:hypothetical protein
MSPSSLANADSLDHSESLEDPLLPLPKQNEIFVCADVFEASFCMHACMHALINPETIHTRIKIPLTRKRINALFFRSPNKKKLGAWEDTKNKYLPTQVTIMLKVKLDF